MTDFWPVELADGTVVSVEPALTTISSYVLIEQEDWFEKEIAFVRRLLLPGMCAIDIGANIGVYTLVMARLVGPAGRVLAVEPLSGPRRHLERSLGLNGLANVAVRAVAVADEAGVGHMQLHAAGTEAASLQAGSGGDGEEVEVTTLDRLAASLALAPDFIKIDAEGAERLVLAGGRDLLARHEPVLMVEIRKDVDVNEGLLRDLIALGFDLYRALPDGAGLVPFVLGAPIDRYELNVFACTAARAEALERRELLTRGVIEWRPADGPSPAAAVEAIGAVAFAAGFPGLFAGAAPSDGYGEVLSAWAVWTSPAYPLAQRYAALRYAYNRLVDILSAAPTLARSMTLMRIAAAVGQRTVAVDITGMLFDHINRPAPQPDEAFLPPHPYYDAVVPVGNLRNWMAAAIAEQYERSRLFSSAYEPLWPGVRDICCASGCASTQMFRRFALRGMLEKLDDSRDARLLQPAPDHRNAGLWRHFMA